MSQPTYIVTTDQPTTVVVSPDQVVAAVPANVQGPAGPAGPAGPNLITDATDLGTLTGVTDPAFLLVGAAAGNAARKLTPTGWGLSNLLATVPAGRVPFADAGGLPTSNAGLTYNSGTSTLTAQNLNPVSGNLRLGTGTSAGVQIGTGSIGTGSDAPVLVAGMNPFGFGLTIQRGDNTNPADLYARALFSRDGLFVWNGSQYTFRNDLGRTRIGAAGVPADDGVSSLQVSGAAAITGNLTLGNGAENSPSLNLGDPTTGFWRASSQSIGMTHQGTASNVFFSDQQRLRSTNRLGWASGSAVLTTIDTELTRSSAGFVGLGSVSNKVVIGHDGTRATVESPAGAMWLKVPGTFSTLQLSSGAGSFPMLTNTVHGTSDGGYVRFENGLELGRITDTMRVDFQAATLRGNLTVRQPLGTAGTHEVRLNHDGTFGTITNPNSTAGFFFNDVNGRATYFARNAIRNSVNCVISWTPNDGDTAPDVGLARLDANTIEVNNGTRTASGGAFRDFVGRTLTASGTARVQGGSIDLSPASSFAVGLNGSSISSLIFNANGTNPRMALVNGTNLVLAAGCRFGFGTASTVASNSSPDAAFSRSSANVVDLDTGTDGAFGDLRLRNLTASVAITAGNAAADTRSIFRSVNSLPLGVSMGSGAFYLGASAATTTPDLVISNNSGVERLRVTDGGVLTTGGSVRLTTYGSYVGVLDNERIEFPNTGILVHGRGTANAVLRVRGPALHTGNLLQLENNAGTAVASVSAAGELNASGLYFNNALGSADLHLNAAVPTTAGNNQLGFRYFSNNQMAFGFYSGARINFLGSGSQAQLLGGWLFPSGAVYPAPALGGSSGGGNDVRLNVAKTGDGAGQTVQMTTQRYAVNNDQPALQISSNGFSLWTRAAAWNAGALSKVFEVASDGNMGWNGVTPVARPTLPDAGTVTAADIRTALISLGLCQ